MFTSICCGLCQAFGPFNHEDMLHVDKALGNVRKSHKAITFTALINIAHKKAVVLHYLAPSDSPFCQVYQA